jgi:hypothetical protein
MIVAALNALQEDDRGPVEPFVNLTKQRLHRLELGERGIVSLLLPVLQRDHDPLICSVLAASEALEKPQDGALTPPDFAAELIARMLSLCRIFRNLCVECASNQTKIGEAGVAAILSRFLVVFCENRPAWREADCSRLVSRFWSLG